jgi:FixJ family two-component response regulator
MNWTHVNPAVEQSRMAAELPMVFVVDDDVSVRESLQLLIRGAGWKVEAFATAHEFLSQPRTNVPCCLILDVVLPELDGLELQQRLIDRKVMPIVFITGLVDVAVTVQAIRAGAVEFLTKPLSHDAVLQAIQNALELSRLALRVDSEMCALKSRYATLTPREREVMKLVVTGLLNKQVGGMLDITENTVKMHRGQMMRKMQARSVCDLVIMAERLQL